MTDYPPVSVILAVRNEAEHLDRCLEAVGSLDYPRDKLEIILVDGMSIDGTREIISSWSRQDERIRLLDNPGRIVSTGMNLALKESKHDYILWSSGHVLLQPDHIRKCLDVMQKTSAAAIGGILHTTAFTTIGKINAAVLSNPFGVGMGKHRVGGCSGWVPLVTMALYRRKAIVAAGGWNESLPRSQDNDLHDRMNRLGYRSYLEATINPTYLCRETFWGFLGQAWNNGYWNIMLKKMGKGGFSPRHFVPMAFVAAVIVFAIAAVFSDVALNLLVGLAILYGVLASVATIWAGIKQRLIWQTRIMPIWFFSLHFTYGIASWAALFAPRK